MGAQVTPPAAPPSCAHHSFDCHSASCLPCPRLEAHLSTHELPAGWGALSSPKDCSQRSTASASTPPEQRLAALVCFSFSHVGSIQLFHHLLTACPAPFRQLSARQGFSQPPPRAARGGCPCSAAAAHVDRSCTPRRIKLHAPITRLAVPAIKEARSSVTRVCNSPMPGPRCGASIQAGVCLLAMYGPTALAPAASQLVSPRQPRSKLLHTRAQRRRPQPDAWRLGLHKLQPGLHPRLRLQRSPDLRSARRGRGV